MISKGIFEAFVQDKVSMDREDAIKLILDRAKKDGIISKDENILLLCKTPFGGEEYFPNIFEVVKVK